MEFLKLYIVSMGAFLALDSIWLGVVAPKFYKSQIGHLMAEKPNFFAAGLFYLLFILGLVFFVVQPALKDVSWLVVAARGAFFGIVAGMEMGTNYTEQNDPEEIRVAWLKEKEKIAAGNPEGQIMDEAFLEALEYGMPPTSGIGPGIDRWVMVMTDSATISDVIAFPMQRAEK
jgi:uncharacterized membrane protein